MPSLRVIFAALLVFPVVVFVGGWFLLRPPAVPRQPQPEPVDLGPPAADPPKLVVLMVFDQMRGDYLARWAELYGPDGFERVKRDGVWFSECHIPYACTSTGPGHASLATGAPPSATGIVENEWYDRKTRAKMYCCQPDRQYDLVPPLPPNVKEPTRGSALGYSPERLLAQTVGESLQEATGGAGRVFSLSIKDRTAVLMGGQKPTGAYCFDTRDGRFHTSAFYGRARENFREHPWVKEFNDSKLADSWFETKWERLRPEAEYVKFCGPDDALGEADGFNGQGRTFPHSLKGALQAPAKKYYDALEGSPFGNELLAALTKKAVTAEGLGRGAAPDLLCVSFSSNDLLGHRWGPNSHEMMDATLRADKMVGAFLTFFDAEVGKGRYVVVISADHGVCPLPEQERTKKEYPAAARVMGGEVAAGLESALDKKYGGPAAWFEAFDADVWPWVYLNQATLRERNLKPDDVAAFARDWFVAQPYLAAAFTRKDLEDGPFPADQPFKKMAALAYRPDRCGDVIVVPKPGVLVAAYPSGTTHSSPQPYDAHVPFLVYGAGVPALGQRTEQVSSLSVAPTLAWALGVPAPKQAVAPLPDVIPAKR